VCFVGLGGFDVCGFWVGVVWVDEYCCWYWFIEWVGYGYWYEVVFMSGCDDVDEVGFVVGLWVGGELV